MLPCVLFMIHLSCFWSFSQRSSLNSLIGFVPYKHFANKDVFTEVVTWTSCMDKICEFLSIHPRPLTRPLSPFAEIFSRMWGLKGSPEYSTVFHKFNNRTILLISILTLWTNLTIWELCWENEVYKGLIPPGLYSRLWAEKENKIIWALWANLKF